MQTAGFGEWDAPLSGVRVIDLSFGKLGAIGRQLVELGAEVIRVEPPAGASDRRAGRTVAGLSISFVAANLGKRAIALDLNAAADREAFEILLADADMLVASLDVESEHLDLEAIAARHSRLVVMSISAFGRASGYRDWQVTDPVLHALTGELSRSGLPKRVPLLPPGTLAEECAAAQATYVLLLAFYNRLKTGRGDFLDFSLLDAAGQALDPGYGISGSAAMGVPASQLPRGRENAGVRYPIIPCADGFTRLCVLAPRQWQGMLEWMGRPEEFSDPAYNNLMNRFRSKTLIPAIAQLFADKTRAQLEAQGQKLGVPTAGVLSPREASESEQMKARGAFRKMPIAAGIEAPFPDGLMEIDGRRVGITGPAPTLESAASIKPAQRWSDQGAVQSILAGERPFSGLRILDLGVIVVGAEQARLFADQGATVFKVETTAFPDGSRQTRDGSLMSPSFAAGHRNKLGLGLNLREPEGKELFLQLVETSDVVFSNFKPGTMESLGLGYASLRARNPRIVVIESSAFGSSGPWSGRLGYGPLVRASSGLTAQWRYTDDELGFSDAITVYPDHVAGRTSAIAAIALLIRRLRTGVGGIASISQAEVMLSHSASAAAEAALLDAGVEVSGRQERDTPWGVFPCAGDDEWCVVSVRDTADFRRLCLAIDEPGLLDEPGLSTPEGRHSERVRLETLLGRWTQSRTPLAVAEQLQAAGVPAAPMLRVSELPEFGYYLERECFVQAEHPSLPESFLTERRPVRSRELPDPVSHPAPLIGEHTAQIAAQYLGLSASVIADLTERKVLECQGR